MRLPSPRPLTISLLALASLLPVVAHALRPDRGGEETAVVREERKVRRLLDAMNQRAILERSTLVSTESFQRMGLPDTFTREFVAAFDYDHVLAMTARVYVEELDEATVDALIAFHESDPGLAFAGAMPEITARLIRLGQDYGEELASRVLEEEAFDAPSSGEEGALGGHVFVDER